MCNAFLPFISVLFLLIQASMQKKLLMERMDILTNASEIYNKTLDGMRQDEKFMKYLKCKQEHDDSKFTSVLLSESLRNLEGWNQDCIEPTKQDYKLLNRLLNDIKKQLENEIKST
ncbi:unnamed protein product [Schistosoma turkestanicum]|nr:unnamed protein product [Schistosoma turkestanicum]